METNDIESMLSKISADASSIQILTLEVSENVEPNSTDYFKLHAVYEVTETQIRNIEKIEERLMEIRHRLQ